MFLLFIVENFTREIYQTTAFQDIFLRSCQQICGLCHRLGARNRCPGAFKECSVLVGLGAIKAPMLRFHLFASISIVNGFSGIFI